VVGAIAHREDWVEVAPTILYSDRSNDELRVILETAQRMRAFPLSVELGLGPGYAGHGTELAGKFSVRVVPRTWGLGVRFMVMDGARRRASPCFIFCNTIESRFYVGAGLGRLSGRRFIGSGTELDRDVSELVLAFEASAYLNPGQRVRINPAAHGHIGAGEVALGITIGVAFGG
jgi:hypothetical protein